MKQLNEFMKNVKGLTKNPLGIIGLFISLIYGFACLVLGVSISNLQTANERLPLIWFIIIFPIVILLAFIFLVINHHQKLYAPSDYKNEDNFLKSMDKFVKRDKTSQSEKISEDVKTLVEDKEDVLRKTNATPLKLSPSDISSLKQNYLLAEDLALKEFELNNNVSLKRNIFLQLENSSKKFEFDGIGEKEGNLFLVEVKFSTLKHLSKKMKLRIQDFLRDIEENENVLSRFIVNLKPVIIIVSEIDNNSGLKRELKDYLKSLKLSVTGKVYSFNELKKSYGLE